MTTDNNSKKKQKNKTNDEVKIKAKEEAVNNGLRVLLSWRS